MADSVFNFIEIKKKKLH